MCEATKIRISFSKRKGGAVFLKEQDLNTIYKRRKGLCLFRFILKRQTSYYPKIITRLKNITLAINY